MPQVNQPGVAASHGADRLESAQKNVRVSKRQRTLAEAAPVLSSDRISADHSAAQGSRHDTLAKLPEFTAQQSSEAASSSHQPIRVQLPIINSHVWGNSPESKYWLADTLRRAKKFPEAFQLFTESNTPQANCELALMHLNGEGTSKNPELAIDILNKLDTNESKRELARIYWSGKDVEKNVPKALALYKASDTASANTAAGTIYYNGEGVDLNYDLAIHHWKRALALFQSKRDRLESKRVLGYLRDAESKQREGRAYREQLIETREQVRAARRTRIEEGISAKEALRLEYVDAVKSKLRRGLSPGTGSYSPSVAKAIYDNFDRDGLTMKQVYIDARNANTLDELELARVRIPNYGRDLGQSAMPKLHWNEDQNFDVRQHAKAILHKTQLLQKLNEMPPASVELQAPWLDQNIIGVIDHIKTARWILTEEQEKAAHDLIEAFLNINPLALSAEARRLGQLL